MYNASDTKHIRRQKALVAKRVERDAAVLLSVMLRPEGRAWMYDLLESCHVFSTSFSPSSLATAFAEGERNVGLQLFLGVVQHCQDQYLQMMRESYGRSITDDRPSGVGQDGGRVAEQPVDNDDGEYDPIDRIDS